MTQMPQMRQVLIGDCVELMAAMPECSIDAIVTDPPYGLGFMGKEWDTFNPAEVEKQKKRDTRTALRRGIYATKGSDKPSAAMAAARYDLSCSANQRFQAWFTEWGKAALRVLKPGGHCLAFGGTRTFHRLTCALEDAGFEIRDCLMWLYGSGFPKSLDVSKAIDKQRTTEIKAGQDVGKWLRQRREGRGLKQNEVAAHWPSVTGALTGCVANWELGFNVPKWEQWLQLKELLDFGDEMDAEVLRLNGRKGKPGDAWFEREVVEARSRSPVNDGSHPILGTYGTDASITTPATDAAREWEGWGTALKPAWEPIVMARKPLAGTVAANVQQHGTGALNIGGCRIGQDRKDTRHGGGERSAHIQQLDPDAKGYDLPTGRWPANVVLDETAAHQLDEQSGNLSSGLMKGGTARAAQDVPGSVCYGVYGGNATGLDTPGDSGGASRFFYCAKAGRGERHVGLADFFWWTPPAKRKMQRTTRGNYARMAEENKLAKKAKKPEPHQIAKGNIHPTVKPINLMRWLVRLVAPPGGVVLDPFAGSGTTLCAVEVEAASNPRSSAVPISWIACEKQPEYADIARARAAWWRKHPDGAIPPEIKEAPGQERLF